MVLRLRKALPLFEAGPPEESPHLGQGGTEQFSLHVIRLIGEDDGLPRRDEEGGVLLSEGFAKLGRVSPMLGQV